MGQIPLQGDQIPPGHHGQGGADVTGVGHQPPVELDPGGLQGGAGAVHQPFHHPGGGGAPGEEAGQQGGGGRQPGGGGEEVAGHAAQGQQGAVEADQAPGGDEPVEAHARQDGGPSGVTHHQVRGLAEAVQQPAQGLGHPGQGEVPRRRRGGEAMAGQIRRQDFEVLRQQGSEPAPGMGGGARAMDQQQAGPLAHYLQVPAHPSLDGEATRLPVGPVAALALPAGSLGHGYATRRTGSNPNPPPPGRRRRGCRPRRRAAADRWRPWPPPVPVPWAGGGARCRPAGR